MANDDKTEKPTGKRKGEARKKGQVAKSTEINGALVLVAGLVAISMQGPAVSRIRSEVSIAPASSMPAPARTSPRRSSRQSSAPAT